VRFDAQSALSNCDSRRYGPLVRSRDWDGLHPSTLRLSLAGSQQTASPLVDPRGLVADPVAASQQHGRGCITTTLPATPGVATYETSLPRELTLNGMPRLSFRYRALGVDIELDSRLWDVAPDGTQTLVTRGAYRAVAPSSEGETADYELFGNAWRFAAGHRLMLEIAQSDAPYLRPDNFPSTATIDDVRLTLPLAP
jgi:predicted acyl esterase